MKYGKKIESGGKWIYEKYEKDWHFFHRNSKSITLDAVDLKSSGAEIVRIHIKPLNTIVEAPIEDIIIKVPQYVANLKEFKYYHPIDLWKVVKGDSSWTDR